MVGYQYTEKGPLPRLQKMQTQRNVIGKLSSGAPSPSLDNVGIGIGYISGVSEGDEIMTLLARENPSKR